MTCHNYNVDRTIINNTNGKIERYTDGNGIWMERKEKDRLLKQMLSQKLSNPKVQRKQLPSISPTTEDMLTDAGSDYGTYFAYKYHGNYARTLHK
ncbi:hypothetical protein [Halodesulfovibrio marinisediminis]|uniref:Uncharacterized protein n=1 Tax=Halodesulfovibrio marinisediminis DSM 17456 TaxID=1121457 RepID=A0A1N6DMN7_9BACT|nr:hypothetical protein [Halodesulfovibrio marinisediminis]SIN72068.1 hypothetical protein SAMN02745161_0322 [Halodesulfovibrio marinisediminis DSM 17456]